MSKLDELIEKLCPNGVQRYILKDICSFQNGFAFKSILFKNQGEKILRITNINDGNITDKNCVYFNVSDYKEDLTSYKVTKGDIVIAMSGATTGKIGCNYSDSTYYLNQRVGLFRPNEKILHKRYLYHWLLSKTNEIYNISSDTGAQENLSSLKMMNFKIPVPPLEIQNEIVYILDKFTALLAELKAELKARKKQYAYYREKLFEFDDEINYLPLKELCKSIKDGMHNLPENTVGKGKYPILSAQNIFASKIDYSGKRYVDEETYLAENKRSNIEKGDVLLTIVATIGRTAVVEENNKFLLQRSVCILKPNELINSYYLKYYLDTYKIQDYMIANAHGAAQAGLYLNQVSEILVPVPALEEQQRIANILEKFDKLCNSLCEGIPAEIEARQKQYEYYRDKLLTFKELGSNK